jgi:predicted NBD/HSP70 family sugar kinase
MPQLSRMTHRASQVARISRDCPTIVLDIGGTTTRVARLDPATGGHERVRRAPTPNYLTHAGTPPDRIMEMLATSIEREVTAALEGELADCIIVGYPGPLSSYGVAVRSPTILGPDSTHEVNVAAMLSELWPHAAIRVLNDLTCAGYSFVRAGQRNFCVLTVGSGIGNKIFLEGSPYVGEHGFGGEIGHLKVSPKHGTPVADLRADLGEIASGRGTVWLAKLWAQRRPQDFCDSALAGLRPDLAEQLWSEQLVAAFRRSDKLAREVVETAAQPLAAALAHIHLGCGLERFFVTGGFASALGEEYRRMLVRMLRECAWELGQDWDSMVVVSDAQREHGLLGACYVASLVRDAQPRTGREANL